MRQLMACLIPLALGAQSPAPPMPMPRDSTLPTISHIGDSTSATAAATAPTASGAGATNFDTARVNVVNRALGGRSSRTYITQGQWDRVLAMLKPGDVVIMKFGHNDASAVNDTSRARGTIRGTGDETVEGSAEQSGSCISSGRKRSGPLMHAIGASAGSSRNRMPLV